MSLIDDCLKNVDLAMSELKAALQAENKIEPEAVTNQEYLTDEQLLSITNIRF